MKEILEGFMPGLKSSLWASVWTVYEMANRWQRGAVYKFWAQETRFCVGACPRDFSQGCVG